MSIKVGDQVPNVTIKRTTAEGAEDVATKSFFEGRKVVLFSVPGAFTPTCSATHLPGFVTKADEIRSKGVAEIACLAVNDPFVMKAWGEQHKAAGKVTMLADGNAEFTKALGLEQDLSVAALGVRGKRFLMVVDNGVVSSLEIEQGRGVEVSGAEACLTGL
jgi:peroxiredoxin